MKGYALECSRIQGFTQPGWRGDNYASFDFLDDLGLWSYIAEFEVHGDIHGAVGGHIAVALDEVNTALTTAKKACLDFDSDFALEMGLDASMLNKSYDYFKDGRALWRESVLEYPAKCDAHTEPINCRPYCSTDSKTAAISLMGWHLFKGTSTASLESDFSGCLADEDLSVF